MRKDLSIILPIYNEEDNIDPLFNEIHEVLDDSNLAFEIIAINDGSSDRSEEILIERAKTDSHLRVVNFRKNSGQTAAFDAGFGHASGKYIVTMDSDLQNDPHDIPKMLGILEEGYDLVVGWRKNRKDGLFLRKVPSRCANWFIRKVTGTKTHDLGCSLKAFKKEIVDELNLYGEMHRFINILAEGVGAKVAEYVVNHRERHAGQSKYGMNRIFKVLLDLLTVWFLQGFKSKPIYVFGGAGFFLIFVGGISTAVTIYQKLAFGYWVHKNPLFILGVMNVVLGFLFFGMGLIAEMIIRTYFEAQNKRTYSVKSVHGFERDKDSKVVELCAE